MGFLTEKEILELAPSELLPHPTPIPTQIVSSDEFTPPPQSERQKEVEARLLDMEEADAANRPFAERLRQLVKRLDLKSFQRALRPRETHG
jgi:hypothetical protein